MEEEEVDGASMLPTFTMMMMMEEEDDVDSNDEWRGA